MSRYALVEKGQLKKYPYTFADLRREYPQVSFPADMSQLDVGYYGVMPVQDTARPAPSDPLTKNVVEVDPTLVGGRWVQTWNEVDASADEIKARQNAATDDATLGEVKADAFVQQFIDMTPQQVIAYVEANVTNIASAKTLLKRMAVMMLLMARREFR